MSRGERRIPLLVNGSIDTKTNPKLVQPGKLLELENQYQLQTGEMKPRNGFSAQPATDNLVSASNLFVTQNGGLATIARNWKSLTSHPQMLKYGTSGTSGWNPETNAPSTVVTLPHPVYTAQVFGVSETLRSGTTPESAVDPDMIEAAGFRAVVWGDGSTATKYMDVREATTGRASSRWALTSGAMQVTGAIKIAQSGSSQSGIFWASTATDIKTRGYTGNGTPATAEISIVGDLAASPFFDVKAIPGTGNIAVAYKAAAGGVKCGIYNPSTGTFTAVVATAGADASFCLAWLDDPLATGNMYLATAGNAAGVVVRTMSATTMVVSATNVIDAAATVNVRNITGHLIASSTNYMVLWDVSAANPVDDIVNQGIWNGAATLQSFAFGQSLYSRSFRFPDGNYHVLLVFSSTVQGSYQLVNCDLIGSATSSGVAPVCVALSGEAAGRRQASSLASPMTSGLSVNVPVVRNRKISTPVGDVVGGNFKTATVLSFTASTQVTHARELGGTVFIPGGILFQDDGAAILPAVFPFYPEVPSGTSSAAGGAMTATGAYSYRTVRKSIDATGRITRSAGSLPFTITLGAGDNRVVLVVDSSAPPNRGPFSSSGVANVGRGEGTVFTEVYRRGPAATGATLYNKVAETANAGASTIIDTMSDATAALGEAAYFNGNTLENFAPPAHSILEVNGNRVGIVNAEDPTEFWFSKEYKAGAGIGFNPLLKVRISGDGAGGLTALASMDGRWILFKRSAIYVLSGDGPNDLGQGSFNAPQAVSRTLGTINAASVIETPDGIMFQAANGGIWLLTRGLGLEYIGSPVEALTAFNPTGIVGAALAGGVAGSSLAMTTVRFVTGQSDGLTLEWDYFHKRWYVHFLRTDGNGIADCANSPVFGWCYVTGAGVLMKETQDQAADVNGSTTVILPKVSFPHLQLAGLAGYQRFKSIDFTVVALAACTLSVDAEYDFSGSLTGTPKTFALTGPGTFQVQYTPPEGKAKITSVRPVVTATGSPTTGTYRLTAAVATIGVKRGSNVSPAERMT